MKRIPCSRLALVALASLACAASLQAQTATVKTIHDFGTTSVASIANVSPNATGPGPNGARPAASVIDGGDGYLYGTTKTGGTNEYGTIYRTNIATGDTAVLYSFINDGDSAYPEAGLVKVGAAFYGAARGDQFDDKGSIFRITPPATATGAAVFETLQIFSGARSGPAEPRGTLVLGQDGRLYGTSVSGGSSNGGTVYSFVPGPAPITVSLTHQFTTFGDGYAPVAGLVTDGEGSFYGVTCRSNSGSSVNIYGTVFSINVNDGVAFSTIYTFTGGVDGAQPCDDLVLGVDGVLYGTTTSGGFSDFTGEGTVFRITTNGVFTSLYSFTDFSDGPPNGLVLGPDGNFYGSSEGLPVGDPFFSPGLRALNPGPGDGTAGTLFRITTDGALVNLYSFSGQGTPNDGARPYGSLLYTGGYFYGVTYAGGLSNAANLGTLFQADVFGAITLGASALTVSESAGYATVEFDRVGGSGGPATVTYSTADGTAKAGSDYTMTNGRVNWADGDAAPKTVLVPIINDTVAEPTETFQLGLSTVGETAVRFNIVSPLTITITDDDSTSAPTPTPSPTPIPTPTPTPTPTPAPSPTPTPTPTPPPSAQPSITLTSPPTDVTINSGVTLPLIASVVDPGSALARVQFLINGVPFGQLGADAPYVFNATSLAAGAYQIQAIATDKYGRQSTSAARTVTVAAPDPAHPSPEAAIVTDLNGRAFLAGSIVPVTSTAKTPDAGDALARVDFYADGVVFASFDGSGAPLTSSGRAPITRAADSPFGAGSVFTANFQMPGTDRLVSMIAVALTKLGRTQVSAPVTLQSVKTTVDKPPVVKIGSPDKGNRVRTKTVVNIPVTATDPDAATPNAITRGPNRRAFDSSGLISRLEYYLNNLKVKDATEAPLGYTVAPPAAGAYVLQAIATDGGGLSTVSDPVMLEAYDPTIVTITPVGLLDVNEGERKGKAFINRAGGDLSGPLTVYYSIGGTATNGVDYVGLDGQPLSGSIVIPAGESNVRLKFHPQTDSVAEGAENVKIKLQASPSGDYDLGSLVKVKINIHDAP